MRPRLLAGVAVGLIVLVAPAAAAADVPEVGTAVLVDGAGRTIDGGGSSTAFTISLSGDDECQGDSANDDYRVNSYLVPVAVAPTDVVFDGLGPTPYAYGDHETFRQPLYATDTSSFASAQLLNNERKGEPGRMQPLPLFSFGVYGAGDLPEGRYRLGIACTRLNAITRIWDAQIVVAADAADEPAGVAWTVVGAAAADGSRAPVVPLVLALALAAGGVTVLLRRRRPSVGSTPQRRNP